MRNRGRNDCNKMYEIYNQAMEYYRYIVATHCTIAEAAEHFKCAKTTLFMRLKHLGLTEQTVMKEIRHENKLRVQKLAVEANREKCRRKKNDSGD